MKFKIDEQNYINYEDNGEGPAIIFLNGFGANSKIWMAQVDFFTKKGYRVITFDYLNHGESSRVKYDLSIDDLIDETLELINYLKVSQPILIGNSMGAAVLFGIINKKGWSFIKTVIAIDQSPKMMNDENWNYGFKDLNVNNFKLVMAEKISHPAYHRIDNGVYQQSKKIDEQYGFSQTKNAPLLLNHARKDWRFIFKDLNKPFLFILGEKSPFFDAAKSKVLTKLNKNIKVKVMNGVGHIPMAEMPEVFNQIVIEFI